MWPVGLDLPILLLQIFYIYRNPKDVAVSQYYFFQMIHHFKGSFDEFAELFLAEKSEFAKVD